MSITNLVDDEKIMMIQGVNGIRLCEEAWMKNGVRDCADKDTPSGYSAGLSLASGEINGLTIN